MKPKFYSWVVVLFCAGLFISENVVAQCNCGDGQPATPVTHYYKLDTTNTPTSTISFPKFPLSIGDLTCVLFQDTLSLITTTSIKNLAEVDVEYSFFLNVTNQFTGPGVSFTENATRNYGPTLLTANGTPGDSTAYGPDLLFNNSANSRTANPSSHADYAGETGNINFVYTVNGGIISTGGGLDSEQKIRSKYWGGFRLTYYWCPHAPLTSSPIKNLSAYKKDGLINIDWETLNEIPFNQYDVEVSFDGKNFQTFRTISAGNDGIPKYSVQYSADMASASKLYFRVKQVVKSGEFGYSPIKTVNLGGTDASLTTYPNPAVSGVRLDFDRAMKGNMEVELINITGQKVYARTYSMRNQPSIQVEWPVKPAPGVYYLRATDKATRDQFVSRIVIK